jgi:hypothetical protein
MAGAVQQARQEFWRPPAPEGIAGQERSNTCDDCGTEFIVGARYCHCCGASRGESSATHTLEIPGPAEVAALGKRFGLTAPVLIAFLFGILCLLAALSVGILFTARTTLDWQAIQLWRIEWLLAAIASFAAGLVLKKAA